MPPLKPEPTPPDVPFEMPKIDLDASKAELEEFDKLLDPLIANRDFAKLEKLARELEESKARFIGGGWKIYSFYSVVTHPRGQDDSNYEALIGFMKSWIEAVPDSSTARSSLASAYIAFAWKARGSGYRNEVSDDAWEIFHERLALASDALKEASQLETRCHLYYQNLLTLAKAQDWDRATADEAYEKAIAFDADYQYFYGQRAVSLLPRWGGDHGEWEAFAKAVRESIGGKRGRQIYYLIVADVMELHNTQFFGETQPSWAYAKEGFRLLVQEHGVTKGKLNEFALMAFNARDSQTMCTAFKYIRNEADYDPIVWKGFYLNTYDKARMAADQFCAVPRMGNQAP